VPEDIISDVVNFLELASAARPPYGVWANICGTDLVRDRDGAVYVSRTTCACRPASRTCSRTASSRSRCSRAVRARVDPAGRRLRSQLLRHVCVDVRRARSTSRACRGADAGHLQLGLLRALVSSRSAWARSRRGQRSMRRRRRMRLRAHDPRPRARRRRSIGASNDTFLDPEAFDTTRCSACRASCARGARQRRSRERSGSGVADDKVVYAYVPKIIEYYLGERRSCRTCRRCSYATTTTASAC
jgi:hypothetical protein